ncbi:UNVERIFIED_CONTAM: TIGR00299 family protein, partial [Euhalothece sp. KZN 001]
MLQILADCSPRPAMDTLVVDASMGAAGDMLLGALLDLGADPSPLARTEAALGLEYVETRVDRSGIAATRVEVVAASDGAPLEGHGPHRTVADVTEIIDAMELPTATHETAVAIVTRLGAAEAAIHDSTLREVVFHEVGADDAIADIVGVLQLLDSLDIHEVLVPPLAVGGGRREMAHGRYPIPAPAVTEIIAASGLQITGGPVDEELLTPTAAAILAEVGTPIEQLPTIDISGVGYGAGSREFPAEANVVRVLRGTVSSPLRSEQICVLETNVDDATPEVLGGLQDTLTAAGAHDVSIVPMTMKKSRPGHLIQVIGPPEAAGQLAEVLA